MQYSTEKEFLTYGITHLKLALSESQIDSLMDYLDIFCKWNGTFNLSAIREPMDMVKLHFLDSLAIAPHIVGQRILDVGTGGGLPGIPLAIVYPERQFTLLDSAGKKTRFLVQVKQTLGLENVEVINSRVEIYQPQDRFDGIVSRAFASLGDMTRQCRHLLGENGRFWAMKGIYPADEIKEIEADYQVENCQQLDVPGVEAQRCFLCITPNASSPVHVPNPNEGV